MQRGEIKVWFALGGNLVAAISDTPAAEAAMRGTELTVQVSTKLNRSHAVTGEEALILPTLGRTDVDLQATGPQFVSVEDTVCAVHATHGAVAPVSPNLLSEVSIVTRLARAVLGDDGPIDWAGFERDYDIIREPISHVVPGFEDFNRQIRQKGGFVLPNGPRDSRTFPTTTGKAMLTVNDLEPVECPPGRLILQTIRSHDQFNTTMYSLNDRYRGIKNGRDVVFVNPDDLAELGLADGDRVDVHSESPRTTGPGAARSSASSRTRRPGAAPPRTSRRRTCWSRWPAPRTAATPRCRRRSSCGWSRAWPDARRRGNSPCPGGRTLVTRQPGPGQSEPPDMPRPGPGEWT